MRRLAAAIAAALALIALTPAAASAATCADYPDQASAQRAADTRDGDGDGIYCESLPCPCSNGPAPAAPRETEQRSCTRPREVQRLVFSAAKYPNIREHYLSAVRGGWPRVLVLHRRKTSFRRDRLLEDFPVRTGYDRDEYPPAVGRETWQADVAYVPSRENRSHGSSLGAQLRPFCRGTRFRYAFE